MPNTALDTMVALTLDYRAKEIYDQIIQTHPLLVWLKEKGKDTVWKGGGENLEFNVRVKRNDSFAARAYKTQLNLAEQDPLKTYELPSRFINGNITWYNAQEEANVGEYKIKSFVDSLINDAMDAAQEAMAAEMWQDGTGEHLHGIPAIVSATNTYAGVARSSGSDAAAPSYGSEGQLWCAMTGASVYKGTTQYGGPYNTAEPLVIEGGTDGGIRKLYNDLCDNGGKNGPDFAITSEFLYNKLCALIGAERIRTNEKMAELGYPENIQYKGATIVWDRESRSVTATLDTAASSTFTFLNSKYLALEPYSGYEKKFKRTPVQSLEPQGIFAKTILMQWRGNLVCTKPSRQGKLTAKTA